MLLSMIIHSKVHPMFGEVPSDNSNSLDMICLYLSNRSLRPYSGKLVNMVSSLKFTSRRGVHNFSIFF